jgi:uncharacterized membrane protein YbhN (UPF0104 family)
MLQDRQLLPPKEKTIQSKVWWVAKWIVTLLILSYIYVTFQQEQTDLQDIGQVLSSTFSNSSLFSLLVLFLLAPLNWTLESLKWMLLARKAVKITFPEAFRSTLTGLAVGVAVPAQLGDTLGRITSLRSEQRLRTLGAALVSNGVQFYVSVLGGTLSWVLVGSSLALPSPNGALIEALLIVILLGGGLVGIFRKNIVNLSSKRLWVTKLKENIGVINQYTIQDLGVALGFGLARYTVFVVQFVLALSLSSLSITMTDLVSCVGLILLAKTLLPAINVIGDLGLRQFTALLVFKSYGLPSEKIVAATFLIWLINILGPLLVGLVMMWKHQWNTRYA